MPITEEQAKAAAHGLVKLLAKASCKADRDLEAGYRDTLKTYCKETGEGFRHEDRLGTVRVSRPTERRAKGLQYELDLEVFLGLGRKERDKLMDGDSALVREVLAYTEERAPSIQVELVE
jgi:hypothetical protein